MTPSPAQTTHTTLHTALEAAFDISKVADVLWIENEADANTLSKNETDVNTISENEADAHNLADGNGDRNFTYDTIVITDCIERVTDPLDLLRAAARHLKTNGTLYLALNNPLGLRYFVGDKDPYTGRNFDSIEDYRRVNKYDRAKLPGRMFDHAQIDEMLKNAGFKNIVQYSAFPNLESLQLLYREDILPNEDISSRIFPLYNSPDTIFLDEYMLQRRLMRNNMFHQFANAYILKCRVVAEADCGEFCHATINLNRGHKYAMVTKITENGEAIKRAIFPQGRQLLYSLKENHEELKSRGIAITDVAVKIYAAYAVGDADASEPGICIPQPLCAVSDFIEGVCGIEYFRDLAKQIKRKSTAEDNIPRKENDSDCTENNPNCKERADIDFLISKVDEFRNIILKSSDNIIEEETGEILLKKGYPDLALLNCIYKDDEPVFFDQEYVIDNLPAKALITRLVDLIYHGNPDLNDLLPREFFEERYGLSDNISRWRHAIGDFMNELKHEQEMAPFYEKHCAREDMINANRQRMNYSPAEYRALFDDIFAGLDNKDLYVFGSGNFAERFISLYGRFYDVKALIDNDEAKWGQKLYGKTITAPSQLEGLNPSSYKIIICIKNYIAVLKQLREAGVKNISVFDPNGVYEVKRSAADYNSENAAINQGADRKPYNVGYIAGVFDLFHIGHLNLLRRAKEQCSYLIVGVVNDEAVIKNKRTNPFVPFDERIEMVRACRYVDEAVEITYENAGTRDAFRLYHFDVQFSGSDYMNNGSWLAEKEFLEKNGSDLIFFPYTEQTSSTKIKKLIEERLV